MPVRVHLQFVKPGMRLASPIFDPDGKLVAGAGTQMNERVVRVLRNMAVQSVLVADGDAVHDWETIKPLEEELRTLDERFGPELRNAALRELRDAIARHLTKRAERLARDPGVGGAPAKS
jgi:hypothetical protein